MDLLARADSEQDAEWLVVLDAAGRAAYQAQDWRTAAAAWERVYEVRSRTMLDEHRDLQSVRLNLAATRFAQGDFSGARALQEKVLEARMRTLSDEHPDVLGARQNLAATLFAQGDLAGARALVEKLLEIKTRTLSDEHPDLRMARQNLAATLHALGDLPGAQTLYEKVLEAASRTLPEDHPDLQIARTNIATILGAQGDLAGAHALYEKAIDVLSRTLPDEHPELQRLRLNLAATVKSQGDLLRARLIEEKVLEVYSRTLPDAHPDLQRARSSLAHTLRDQGNLPVARALFEQVLEINSRTLPDEHPSLQNARLNLASTLHSQGDLAGARALEEKVLDVGSRALPDEHPDLQLARLNLAATLYAQGDLAGARVLFEKVLDVRSRTLPDEHPDMQISRGNLAATLASLGDLAGARALFDEVLEISSRTLPDEHPALQRARSNLAHTLEVGGDIAGARALFEQVLDVSSRALPDDHADLQRERVAVARTTAIELTRSAIGKNGERTRDWEAGRARCAELIGHVCRSRVRAARTAILWSSAREAEERCWSTAKDLGASLSFAQGLGELGPLVELVSPAFEFSETTRGAAIAAAGIARAAVKSPSYAKLRTAMREASDELAALAQRGAANEELDRARAKREAAERELSALAGTMPADDTRGLEIDARSLADDLGVGTAAVGFRRFTRSRITVDSTGENVTSTSEECLCAFVVRGGASTQASGSSSFKPLELVDLGPIAPIEESVREWRAALGAGTGTRGTAATAAVVARDARALGARLRVSVFDPLSPALAGAERIILALDDVLHLVPLDALPLGSQSAEDGESGACVGDRWRIETRTTLAEIVRVREPLDADHAGSLVAFGDVDYGAPVMIAAAETSRVRSGRDSDASETTRAMTESAEGAARTADVLRGSAWADGFSALPATGAEVRGLAHLYAGLRGEAAVEMSAGPTATREALKELAPNARFLHLATHGWFAPESIRSWQDPEPLDKLAGLGLRQSSGDRVQGMSPMLLCGLALADANLPERAHDGAPGLITADEISTLDLSNCELAVLSACDTNVGSRRAGQGVASLQKALHMAGARSVITSLWKVPDEATKELMLDFYRRLWVEKKPKWQALWEAKTQLRNAKDERGAPKYSTRDWAAWVLTGEPD